MVFAALLPLSSIFLSLYLTVFWRIHCSINLQAGDLLPYIKWEQQEYCDFNPGYDIASGQEYCCPLCVVFEHLSRVKSNIYMKHTTLITPKQSDYIIEQILFQCLSI